MQLGTTDTRQEKLAVTEAGVRRLNPMDTIMLSVDRALRSVNHPGFETQALVWLTGRVDVPRLRAALGRFQLRYPEVTARLVDSLRGPHWRQDPLARCSLHEVELADSTSKAVLERAAGLLSTSRDPRHWDPIRFYLFHLPDGRDVFLFQYNHTLMDNNAAAFVLRQLRRVAGSEAAISDSPETDTRDPLTDYLARFPRGARYRAVYNAMDLRLRQLRGRPLTLGNNPSLPSDAMNFGIVTRSLDAPTTKLIEDRITKTCGFPSLSMALLACAFRALLKLAPTNEAAQEKLVAGIGVDLGLRRRASPLFGNLFSVIPLDASPEDTRELAALTQSLSAQLRDRLGRRIDLGVIQLARLFQRRGRFLRWFVRHLLQGGYSLWYAYFGALDAVGSSFFGAGVEKVYYVGPCWPPLGLTLLANQYAGQLHLQATYLPACVAKPMADEFLDLVVADLTDSSEAATSDGREGRRAETAKTLRGSSDTVFGSPLS